MMPSPDYRLQPCNIVIIGASGDLSSRKLIPALFSVYCNDLLPEKFEIIGFARTRFTDQQFRDRIIRHLTCRYEPEQSRCQGKMNGFLERCFYTPGYYDSVDSFSELQRKIGEIGCANANTLFYMAIPPSIFIETACSIHRTHMTSAKRNGERWSRVVLEKPFGRDSQSSRELIQTFAGIFQEEQIYRIDHYLGKEVIQNLMILRFANLIFEPVWNKDYIESISIAWTEKIGCRGRAGYFDNYGIIRDVMQNHLLQIIALVGMEKPDKLDAEQISDQKVSLLKCIQPIALSDIIVGQYTAGKAGNAPEQGYLDDPDVPSDSITPTYAEAVLKGWLYRRICTFGGSGSTSSGGRPLTVRRYNSIQFRQCTTEGLTPSLSSQCSIT